ncbi:MAG: hypothetical protein LQ343_006913 [Gyalolechia ehrenbergii]|nr:MAG: hypothetical protein LQ343_006913 [Gyalolechia ehrenbergii]
MDNAPYLSTNESLPDANEQALEPVTPAPTQLPTRTPSPSTIQIPMPVPIPIQTPTPTPTSALEEPDRERSGPDARAITTPAPNTGKTPHRRLRSGRGEQTPQSQRRRRQNPRREELQISLPAFGFNDFSYSRLGVLDFDANGFSPEVSTALQSRDRRPSHASHPSSTVNGSQAPSDQSLTFFSIDHRPLEPDDSSSQLGAAHGAGTAESAVSSYNVRAIDANSQRSGDLRSQTGSDSVVATAPGSVTRANTDRSVFTAAEGVSSLPDSQRSTASRRCILPVLSEWQRNGWIRTNWAALVEVSPNYDRPPGEFERSWRMYERDCLDGNRVQVHAKFQVYGTPERYQYDLIKCWVQFNVGLHHDRSNPWPPGYQRRWYATEDDLVSNASAETWLSYY